MKSFRPATALACAIALSSFGVYAQTTTAPSTAPSVPQSDTATQPATTPSDRQSSLSSEDESFLENAIQGSHAEIVGSQLALEKSEDSEVRNFAQTMIDDHGKMVKEAEALAAQKGMTAPTGPSVVQSTEITALKALTGGAFDAMYVNRIGVASHEATIEMFEKAGREAQDSDVKAMVDKTLPRLREHLEMARALDQKQDRQ